MRRYRADAVLCNKYGKAQMIIECKAPTVKLTEKDFRQVIQYNRHLDADVLLLTNGTTHFCWQLNRVIGQFQVLHHIPLYQQLIQNSTY